MLRLCSGGVGAGGGGGAAVHEGAGARRADRSGEGLGAWNGRTEEGVVYVSVDMADGDDKTWMRIHIQGAERCHPRQVKSLHVRNAARDRPSLDATPLLEMSA